MDVRVGAATRSLHNLLHPALLLRPPQTSSDLPDLPGPHQASLAPPTRSRARPAPPVPAPVPLVALRPCICFLCMLCKKNHDGFHCIKCGREFKRKEHLERHLTTHTGIKAFVCPLCFISFGRKDLLARHHSNYHEPPDPMETPSRGVPALGGQQDIASRAEAAAQNTEQGHSTATPSTAMSSVDETTLPNREDNSAEVPLFDTDALTMAIASSLPQPDNTGFTSSPRGMPQLSLDTGSPAGMVDMLSTPIHGSQDWDQFTSENFLEQDHNQYTEMDWPDSGAGHAFNPGSAQPSMQAMFYPAMLPEMAQELQGAKQVQRPCHQQPGFQPMYHEQSNYQQIHQRQDKSLDPRLCTQQFYPVQTHFTQHVPQQFSQHIPQQFQPPLQSQAHQYLMLHPPPSQQVFLVAKNAIAQNPEPISTEEQAMDLSFFDPAMFAQGGSSSRS
ncbi:hypothetical protein Micbo1qcDRAFT_195936 [Microdochium bolleyi]|uniref:C2H2-type domain-containing protein n=1 Tax=Microdochium bolleyi TaxID=196109 RepID=A0A136J1Q9_9PEZI|nr:hypothetical protein Micbo1qcDRAFT_195936 [Microdochium bolleyi]